MMPSVKKITASALSGLSSLREAAVLSLLIFAVAPWWALLTILALPYRGYRAIDLWARWDGDAGRRALCESKEKWRSR